MDTLISALKAKADSNPKDQVLRAALERLHGLKETTSDSRRAAWDAVEHDFKELWSSDDHLRSLLDSTRASFIEGGIAEPETGRSASTSRRDISVFHVPRTQSNFLSSLSISAPNEALLPVELVELLNDAYFLHVLATDPDKVLPPGKSLLSMLVSPAAHAGTSEPSALHTRVESIVHRAFWDEARESLRSQTPAAQLARLRGLYGDLHEVLTPLLPPTHPLLDLLSHPLSPTPSPRQSALFHLREILMALRERCAPIRDAHIDALLQSLDAGGAPGTEQKQADLVVDTVKAILELAKTMKNDLAQFVLGSMGEEQLRGVVLQQARARERSAILQLWSQNIIKKRWKEWIGEQPWTARLVQALTSDIPVSCHLPTSSAQNASSPPPSQANEPEVPSGNALPPVFLFAAPSLLHLQNFIQALVIAASLRSLARLPPLSSSSQPSDFMQRIWALLTSELDTSAADAGSTKLANLADEVIRASSTPTGDEALVRAAVSRTLQTTDRAFSLLRTRFADALVMRLAEAPLSGDVVPPRMQTGTDRERPGKRPRLVLDAEDVDHPAPARVDQTPLVVKGFEDPVLVSAAAEALEKVRTCVSWIEGTWGDVAFSGEDT